MKLAQQNLKRFVYQSIGNLLRRREKISNACCKIFMKITLSQFEPILSICRRFLNSVTL